MWRWKYCGNYRKRVCVKMSVQSCFRQVHKKRVSFQICMALEMLWELSQACVCVCVWKCVLNDPRTNAWHNRTEQLRFEQCGNKVIPILPELLARVFLLQTSYVKLCNPPPGFFKAHFFQSDQKSLIIYGLVRSKPCPARKKGIFCRLPTATTFTSVVLLVSTFYSGIS